MDDYHLVEAPEVHRSLEFLLDHLPPALHLVLASRSDPPLPLARLRARGQLAELRARRPALHRRARPPSCCAPRSGAHLPDGVVAALGERTEGWAAGLQLAALSLQGRGDVSRFVAEFSGSHRFVLDYLTEEVLERQPDELRTFLLETSVLERLCGPLCDAVVGPPGRPAAAGVGRAGQPVPDPARRGAPVVALPPPVRRSAARQPAAAAPGPGAGAAPRGGGLVRASTGCPTTPSGTRWPRGDTARAAELVEEHLEEQVWRRAQGATIAAWLAALPVRGDPPQAAADPRAGRRRAHGGQAGRGRAAPRRGRAGAGAHAGRAVPRVARPPVQRAGQHPRGHRGVPRRPGADARRRRAPSRRSPVPRSPTYRAGRAARRGRPLPGGVRRLARGPGGGRRARAGGRLRRAGRVRRSTTSCRAPRSTSAPSSSPGGTSARRCAPTSRGCGSRRAIDRRRRRACCTSGWPRCTSNATSWPTRTGWSPRASSSAAGSRTSRP